jgi:hypothetical protein
MRTVEKSNEELTSGWLVGCTQGAEVPVPPDAISMQGKMGECHKISHFLPSNTPTPPSKATI